MSYLSPASSSDVPSAPILNRTSMSGTRLMHTAIFNRDPHVKDFTQRYQKRARGSKTQSGVRLPLPDPHSAVPFLAVPPAVHSALRFLAARNIRHAPPPCLRRC